MIYVKIIDLICFKIYLFLINNENKSNQLFLINKTINSQLCLTLYLLCVSVAAVNFCDLFIIV